METTTTALLDRWKRAQGLGSDYAAAKALGVSQGTLSNWRHGRSHADVELAAKMAEALGLDTLGTLAAIQADRETRPGAAAVWRRYGKGAFMALALGVSVGVSSPGNAMREVGQMDIGDLMRNRWRRWKERFQGAVAALAPVAIREPQHQPAPMTL